MALIYPHEIGALFVFTLYLRDALIIACYIPCLFLIATTIWVRSYRSVAWVKEAGWQLTLLHGGILAVLSLTAMVAYLAVNPTESLTVLSTEAVNVPLKLIMLGELLAIFASVILFYAKVEATDLKVFQTICIAAGAAFLLIPLLVLRAH